MGQFLVLGVDADRFSFDGILWDFFRHRRLVRNTVRILCVDGDFYAISHDEDSFRLAVSFLDAVRSSRRNVHMDSADCCGCRSCCRSGVSRLHHRIERFNA